MPLPSIYEEQNVQCHVVLTEGHWQLGRAKRHGAILQKMLDKFHVDRPIRSLADFTQALTQICNAENSLSRTKGYTPELLVLGCTR